MLVIFLLISLSFEDLRIKILNDYKFKQNFNANK